MIAHVCHCGHDRDTHHEAKGVCLGMLCDCPQYVHRDDPKPPKTAPARVVTIYDDETETRFNTPLMPSRRWPWP